MLIKTFECRYAKQSKVMFKVAGYSDAMKVKLDRGQSQPQTSEKGDPGAVSGARSEDLHAASHHCLELWHPEHRAKL